jgi:hydrogenase-4 component F
VALALVIVPLVLALAAFAVRSNSLRPWIITLGGAAHLGLTLLCFREAELSALGGWIVIDRLGRVVLGLVSVLFFLCSVYAPGYLRQHPARSNRVFSACLLSFLAFATLMISSHHLGLMWVAIEATTLSTAPLIYFNHNPRSLEATWKYLLVGSVGIAIALFGSLFLGYAALSSGMESSLLFEDLIREAPRLSRPWLESAFVLLFVGYGTKMGLAPMHTWKPDAYGEAPGIVGTLLAGGMTSCAFLAVLRFFQILAATGDVAFARQLMTVVGLLSMAVAGAFMARQRDYKRMLAYSSVEHMGILALGVALGGEATFGALLHLVNNGLTKGVLFLSAGNIHRVYDSKTTDVVSGALRRVPASGALFLAGFFAVTGSPPFGVFLSEFTILRSAVSSGHYFIGAAFLVLLVVIFLGMGATVLAVVQGKPPERPAGNTFRDTFLTVAPVAGFLGLSLLLGVYLPRPLDTLLHQAASLLEVRP